ncbi:MAG TPA: hypothetical protein VG733_07985 [Chthoniobacteraceae bacterium]|nr:hypothetical protein [Chthoniobacteraceae bacterium]
MSKQRYTCGSALLIVFWAIAIMSICVLGLIGFLYSDLDETTALKNDMHARQLAGAGVAVGMHPSVSRGDPVLKQMLSDGEGFEVSLHSEGGRLNINNVLRNQQWSVLQNLFEEWGLPGDEIMSLTSAFKDRATNSIQPNSLQTDIPQVADDPVVAVSGTNGVQSIIRLFSSVDEMSTVPGMNDVAQARPDWRDYFTVWSDGPLDLNDAPADLIAAVTGVGMERAQQFVDARVGPDAIRDTQDDLVFTDLNQVRSLLGMSQEEFAAIQGMVSIQDSTARIESTGIFGTYKRKITVVVRKNVTPPVYFLWQEK